MTIGMVVVAFIAATVLGLIPNDNVHSEPDQVCSKHGHPFHLAVGKAILDDNILANALAEAPQALFKCFAEMVHLLLRRGHEESHPVNSPCRIVAHSRQAAKLLPRHPVRDEIAALHVPPQVQETSHIGKSELHQ